MTFWKTLAPGIRPQAATGQDSARGTGLRVRDVVFSYGGADVVQDVSLALPDGEFTVIIGPNGCGKSTLLKGFARILKPRRGRVTLDGRDLADFGGREFARQLALLPQNTVAPEGITVRDLVARGRFPYHTLLRQWSPDDERAIAGALERTGLAESCEARVTELSGGQRQRVWLAMVLAQGTGTLLLDEPTTFLDIAHQYEVLELCADLRRDGRTVVAVLHDLNQAARFASHLVVMSGGRAVAEGEPARVLTAELVAEVFGLVCDIVPDPASGTPMVVPHVRGGV